MYKQLSGFKNTFDASIKPSSSRTAEKHEAIINWKAFFGNKIWRDGVGVT